MILRKSSIEKCWKQERKYKMMFVVFVLLFMCNVYGSENMSLWNVTYSIKECNDAVMNNVNFHKSVIDSLYGVLIEDCSAVVPSLYCEYVKEESCFKYSFNVNNVAADCVIVPSSNEVTVNIQTVKDLFDRDSMALFLSYCFCTEKCTYDTV